MGPMLPIVNPVLWEIGHVGWFHEFWTLRHAHDEAPLLERADALWNSSTVAHATRWDLDLPSRSGVFDYMTNVLERQLDRLAGGESKRPRGIFMSCRSATRICTSRRWPIRGKRSAIRGRKGLGDSIVPRPGAFPGDADVPGGRWRLGSAPTDGFVFDNEKWAHDVDIAPYRIAKAPVTNEEFAAFVEANGYLRPEFWCAEGWAWRERSGARKPVYWIAKEGQAWTWRRNRAIEPLAPHAR